MKKVLFRLSAILILAAMLAGMILPMTVVASEITNSLGKYPYPYPYQGNRLEYCGWNMKDNTPNSIWYNSSETSFYNTKTPTAYVDSTGKTHEFGVGMHSAIKYAPSTVYSVNDFAITSFKTTVYLVQYDLADEEGKIDVSNLEMGEADGQCIPIVVYLDLGTTVDGKIQWSQPNEDTGVVTYFQEESLVGKGDSVVLEVDKATLQDRNVSHIRIGIKTTHGIYETVTEEVDGVPKETQMLVENQNTAMASIYFADLEITQSRVVPLLEAPNIPLRPVTYPEQSDAYEVILPPEVDEANWWGKPYGAWMAGSNTKYYLSDMTYLVASNTPNQIYAYGQPTTINGPYGKPNTTMFFGAYIDAADPGMSHEIENGISMHPKNPAQPVLGRTDSWTIYDISDYTEAGADTFYALVGLVVDTNDWGSRLTAAGVYVYIYGDKTGDGEHYELLAQSELVKGYNIGEFNVNVEGVKLLLIDVILPETATTHGYSVVGFGNACLFKADEDAVKPDYTGDAPESEDDHLYSGGKWIPSSETQHKMTCDCGKEAIYEDHSWNNGETIVAPTHQQTGFTIYTCNECGYQKTEVFEKIPHEWLGVWLIENKTQHKYVCACGEIEYADHVYTDEKDRFCNDCGYQRTLPGSVAPEKGDSDGSASTGKDSMSFLDDELDGEFEEVVIGCSSVTGGGALSIAIMGLSAGWFVMKKKKSDDED